MEILSCGLAQSLLVCPRRNPASETPVASYREQLRKALTQHNVYHVSTAMVKHVKQVASPPLMNRLIACSGLQTLNQTNHQPFLKDIDYLEVTNMYSWKRRPTTTTKCRQRQKQRRQRRQRQQRRPRQPQPQSQPQPQPHTQPQP